jgi:hypothetical protein
MFERFSWVLLELVSIVREAFPENITLKPMFINLLKNCNSVNDLRCIVQRIQLQTALKT